MTPYRIIISLIIYTIGLIVGIALTRSFVRPKTGFIYSMGLYITTIELILIIIHFVTYNSPTLKGIVSVYIYIQLFLTPLALTLLTLVNNKISIHLKTFSIVIILACFNLFFIAKPELFEPSWGYCVFIDIMVLLQIQFKSILRSANKFKFIGIGLVAELLLIIAGSSQDFCHSLRSNTQGLICLPLLPDSAIFILHHRRKNSVAC